jgi:hypothetical protein
VSTSQPAVLGSTAMTSSSELMLVAGRSSVISNTECSVTGIGQVVSVGSELLQVGLADVEPLPQAVLPRRMGCNLALENLAAIMNPNLEDSHIVYLQAFPQTAVDGCLQVYLHVALILIHHCPVRHLKLNRQLSQRLVH